MKQNYVLWISLISYLRFDEKTTNHVLDLNFYEHIYVVYKLWSSTMRQYSASVAQSLEEVGVPRHCFWNDEMHLQLIHLWHATPDVHRLHLGEQVRSLLHQLVADIHPRTKDKDNGIWRYLTSRERTPNEQGRTKYITWEIPLWLQGGLYVHIGHLS